MSQIVDYHTYHEAWTTLHKIFSTTSRARIMQLRLEFQTIKKGGDAMMEYILHMKTLTDKLTVVGEPISDWDQNLEILGGLSPEYNSIVASLTTRDDDLSLHSVHNMLLTLEQLLNIQQTSSTNISSITKHMATHSTSSHKQQSFKRPMTRSFSH